ncbi:phenolic glucoside malonyltransferase 1-like [Ziziphus jujuba]|uniref:Phenolic glucoside malonyltransferase 1-like n=1 Tax=Ziziphus jujuba TaxID=326968 RepID=A0A6P3YRR2_ZIZJJ|nr:phenolic glucoside malonyltransferase 1-like [Ziziphus jujuba]
MVGEDICLVKAKGNSRESKSKIYLVLNADYRARLDPPVLENYFGNCIGSHLVTLEEAECMELQDGLAIVAAKIGEVIKGLENGVLEGAEKRLSNWGSLGGGAQVIGVSGSYRFGLYSLDFGWGKPKKMEITSIDRNGAFSMAESRDGSGGVEIGLVLKKHEMELFGSLFHEGLEDYSTA